MWEKVPPRGQLPPPESIPKDEWQKKERERGATFPQHITELRARVRSPEQQALYEALQEKADALREALFARWPEPWNLAQEEHNEIVRRYELEFARLASDARGLADSYRGFNVGGAVVGYKDPRVHITGDAHPRYPSDHRENPWRVLFDANTRPETVDGVVGESGLPPEQRRSDVRKYCAELYLSDRIDPSKPEFGMPEEKMDKALALFIVGEAQIDDDSTVRQITLTSCKLCRDRLWKMTFAKDEHGRERVPVYSLDTPVISADARDVRLRKWQPIKRLHEFHNELPPRTYEID